MIKLFRERFNHHIDLDVLEHPAELRLSENAMWLLSQRYFIQRYDEEEEGIRQERSFEEFARRISRIIASAETLYLEKDDPQSLPWLQILEMNIFNDILNRRFLFNSPCLFSAGAGMTIVPELAERIYKSPTEMTFEDYATLLEAKTKNQQLFACFVINIPDSIEGIFDSVKDASIISKFGGGVGGNFGNLRERGADINGGTGGQASGPISFMETWNTMGSVVVQGGRRRAALMGMLYDNHPDIMDFIDAKVEEGKLSYFNISVCVSDRLIQAVHDDGDFPLLSRINGSVVRTLPARELWDKLCESAWRRGDPGVFFIDRANVDNLLKLDKEWRIESTNPCGEQPLPNYTSCNLGSINVESFVTAKGGLPFFDMEAFVDQVYRSMYYLDLVIDACSYPLKRIEERTKKIRPVGLGIMGLADAAIMLGMRYGSESFNLYCTSLGESLAAAALCATEELVSSANKTPFDESHLVEKLFKLFKEETEGEDLFSEEWFARVGEEDLYALIATMRATETIPYTLVNALESVLTHDSMGNEEERIQKVKNLLKALASGNIRNSRRLSIAPTGSISMLVDTSSGIEPNFAWSWTRRIMKTDGSGHELRQFCHKLLDEEQQEELQQTGALSNPIYVTAYDISTDEHVAVTGIFARYIDSGISKTVNLLNSATVDDVKRVYAMCYKMGAKGITIYRDGSRSAQPIEVKKKEEIERKAEEKTHTSKVKKRPGLIVFGKTIKQKTPWGSMYVTLNFDGCEPFEVFATIGKSGSELNAMTEALSRAISIGLRSGGKLEDFIATLKGLSGKEYWVFDYDDTHIARSIPDAIAMLLEKLIEKEGHLEEKHDLRCPECGSPMEMISGCAYCFSCGYSPCK